MPRIRTIKQAFDELIHADPSTAMTEFRIRQLILSGAIPSFKAGTRYMIDMDNLEEYLTNPPSIQHEEPHGIRPINVRR